jgi:hypothetical protein
MRGMDRPSLATAYRVASVARTGVSQRWA